jgi:hypothetical protein
MASSLGGFEHACREKLASKARPGLFLDRPFDRAMGKRVAPYRTFALGIVVDAVRALSENPDAIPADADPVEGAAILVDSLLTSGAPAHAGARTWAIHALTSYLEADEYLRDDLPGLRPAGSRAVLYKSPDGEVKEIDVWGLWLRDPQAGIVELRMLRQRSIDDVAPRDPAVVGVAAKIAADGQPYEVDVKRWRPFLGMSDPGGPVQRVRVVDIGLADASYDVLFDGTVEEARELYKATAAPVVPAVLAGGGYSPGRQCDGCFIIEGCPVMPRRPGMLGVVGLATHRRYLTHTRLRDYEICPARYWLADEAGVPRAPYESTSASRRGVLVHSALEWLHSRGTGAACTAADIEASADALPEVAAAIGALPDEWREVASYLRHHLDSCPFAHDVDWVQPEPSIVAFDNEADVVVTARPDLVTGVGGKVVWRETKTTAVAPVDDELLLLEQFPQLALGLVLVASGVVPTQADGLVEVAGLGDTDVVVPGVVELEVLTPTGGRLVSYSTTDAATLLRARVLLSSRVDPWLRDTAFEAQPGQQCGWCPVQEWCRPDLASSAARQAVAMIVDGFRVDPETGEILPVDGAGDVVAGTGTGAPTPTARVRSLAESIVGVSAEASDEDLPF